MQPNFEIVTTISDKLFPLPVVTDWGFHSLVDSVCTEQERLSPAPGIVARANRMNRYYITEWACQVETNEDSILWLQYNLDFSSIMVENFERFVDL